MKPRTRPLTVTVLRALSETYIISHAFAAHVDSAASLRRSVIERHEKDKRGEENNSRMIVHSGHV